MQLISAARRTTAALATAALAVSGVALAAGPAAAGDADTLDLEAFFDDQYPHLTLEDFEAVNGSDGAATACDGPIDSTTTNECVVAGALVEGVSYSVANSTETPTLAVTGAGFYGPSKALATNYGAPSMVLTFSTPVDVLGLDLLAIAGDAAVNDCTFVLTFVDGSADDTVSSPCDDTRAFVGIQADRLIESVTITDTGGGFEYIDDVRFGLQEVPEPEPEPEPEPSNDITVLAAKVKKKTGTAILPVRVPGVGTTTVSGPRTKRQSADSARARTLRFTVTPKGAARKKLNRKGRLTVPVTVSYTPVGGTKATTKVKITLKVKVRNKKR